MHRARLVALTPARLAALILALLAVLLPPAPAAWAAGDGEVVLAFVGDVMPGPWLTRRGTDHPWRHVAPLLRSADIAVGNLETAVGTGGAPVPDKQFHFRIRPDALAGAAGAGVDVFSLANNHTGDYGPRLLTETVRLVRSAGIHPAGAGADAAEAYAPAILKAGGLSVALLAFSRVVPHESWVAAPFRPGVANGWDVAACLEAVRRAHTEADLVVVLVHWGTELEERPRAADVSFARQLQEHGAAVVVGHHPHVLQGLDFRGGKLVAYSLGNFLFPDSGKPLPRETAVLEVTAGRDGVRSARVLPHLIQGGHPQSAPAAVRRQILGRLNSLSGRWNTSVRSDGSVEAEP